MTPRLPQAGNAFLRGDGSVIKRLHDWLVRPSRADLEERLKLNATINANLLVDLCDAREEIKHLKSDLDVARDEAEMHKQSYEDAEDDAEAFQTENDLLRDALNWLRKVGIESVEKTPVHSIDIEPNGAVEITTRPPHWTIRS